MDEVDWIQCSDFEWVGHLSGQLCVPGSILESG